MTNAAIEPAGSLEPVGSERRGRVRYGVLDGLRLAAALAVLMYHFTARDHDSWGISPATVFPTLHKFTAYGAFGVDLFFIISGFVILMTAWGRTVPEFVGSRAGRLLPAYWTGLLLTTLLVTVIWPAATSVSFPQVLVNLTMFQTAFGVEHVDGVYWTLWTELRFYILIGVFMAVGITFRRLILVAWLWPVIAAIAQTTHLDFVADLLISDYAPLFAGGMMLYCLTREPRSVVVWLVFLQNVVIAAAWTAPITGNAIGRYSATEPNQLAVTLVVIGCFALVLVASLTPLKHISWKWLTLAGALTYPLYLIHEYWGWWFIKVIHPYLPHWPTLLIALVLCLILAWLIHRLVERPVGPRLRAWVTTSLARAGDPAQTTGVGR